MCNKCHAIQINQKYTKRRKNKNISLLLREKMHKMNNCKCSFEQRWCGQLKSFCLVELFFCCSGSIENFPFAFCMPLQEADTWNSEREREINTLFSFQFDFVFVNREAFKRYTQMVNVQRILYKNDRVSLKIINEPNQKCKKMYNSSSNLFTNFNCPNKIMKTMCREIVTRCDR